MNNTNNIKIWGKIFKILKKQKKDLIIMIATSVLIGILDVLTPLVSSEALKIFFSDNPKYEYTTLFITIYVVIALLYMISVYYFVKKAGDIEAFVSYEIRKEAFNKLQELSLSYYDNNTSGWIMARLTSDSRKLSEIISWSLVDFVFGISTMIFILVMLYIKSALLALIITILLPIVFIICIVIRKKVLKDYRNIRKINSQITSCFNECIQSARTTKTLVIEEDKYKDFNVVCKDMRKHSIKAVLRTSLLWPLIFIVSYIGVTTTLSIGSASVLKVISGITITAPVLYLFVNYTTMFFDPVLNISSILAELQQAQAACERVFSLIETKPEITDTQEVIDKYGSITNDVKCENKLKGDIKFENVTFSYIENEVVLDNFSLEVSAGTSVALVGKTGSGKSTIVNLLCRFYEMQKGNIYIDGINYKQLSVKYIHENIGYVLQTPHLFNGTIYENIIYGDQSLSIDDVKNICTKLHLDDLINSLEDGLNTKVGDGGARLSVGQRQLISFARAIIKTPNILILDEATSSIDAKTEFQLKKVVDEIMKDRTTFIVAHRLSTIKNCDLILVIDDGKIIEKGNHKELLRLKGEYYNLYKNQFIDDAIERSKE